MNTTIKIYFHSNFLDNKTRKYIRNFNYYNLYKDSCYYCKDMFQLKKRSLKDLIFKKKNIKTYTFESKFFNWNILFKKENLFKNFKIKNNIPIKKSFKHIYIAPMLDTVTHLNDLLYTLTKDSEEYKELEKMIMFFYSMPLSSILVFDKKVTETNLKDFLDKE